MSELCAWCKNREALRYARYEGCCSLHCRDLMECDQEITKRDKRIKALEGVIGVEKVEIVDEREKLKARNKTLEGVVELAKRVIDLAVSLRDEDGYCPLCTEGKTGCVVLEMERYISRLEEV